MDFGTLLGKTDYFRRSPARAGGRRGHKEWHHFCLQQGDLDLLVNFSVSDEIEPVGKGSWTERAHVIVLLREGETWIGDADRFGEADIDIGGGEVAARVGQSRIELCNGAFHVTARLRDVPVEVDLVLSPETVPSFANNIRLTREDALSWLVVPRLRTSGAVRVAERTLRIQDALAYHDHNWGHFAWGADFSWEWGYGAPVDAACPWSFMLVRLSDRARVSTRTQALTLWHGGDIVRSFRGKDLRVSATGFLRPERVFKVPPVMALLAPGTATEVPRTLEIVADADGDRLEITMEARSVAQILVPDDRTAGVTIVNEVAATVRATGHVLEEPVSYEGRGMFEVLAS